MALNTEPHRPPKIYPRSTRRGFRHRTPAIGGL